ncbi:zf-HC2 domain-containing protein [Asanoa sp. NPDC050611]|uniref:zf-HC2 domain-containing protein n=1 Tax=Asanoa sp. NPDC050611 TaxID=3157098 RepID=UPI0033D0900D
MSRCPLTHSVAALLLGALEPRERVALMRHLPRCARCRAAVVELAPLPGLLNLLRPRP